MIDHLCVTSAAPDLSPYECDWRGPNPVNCVIDGYAVSIVPVTVIRTEASETDPAIIAPGFWFAVRGVQVIDLPWTTVSITDSDLAADGQPFVIAKHPDWDWPQLTGRVYPVWAGTEYPFGPDMGPHLLVGG